MYKGYNNARFSVILILMIFHMTYMYYLGICISYMIYFLLHYLYPEIFGHSDFDTMILYLQSCCFEIKMDQAFGERQHPSAHRCENKQPDTYPQVGKCNNFASVHYLTNGQAYMGQMGKCTRGCTTANLVNSIEFRKKSTHSFRYAHFGRWTSQYGSNGQP